MMELLMVIMIIAVLAGLVVSIAAIAGRKSDRAKALADMESIRNKLEEYRIEHGGYPDSEAAMGGLGIANDPWGWPYIYNHDPKAGKFTYSLYSRGPDAKEGTSDDVSIETGGN